MRMILGTIREKRTNEGNGRKDRQESEGRIARQAVAFHDLTEGLFQLRVI